MVGWQPSIADAFPVPIIWTNIRANFAQHLRYSGSSKTVAV
jgi:hypothetical protein